jgi:hypothetical protein
MLYNIDEYKQDGKLRRSRINRIGSAEKLLVNLQYESYKYCF